MDKGHKIEFPRLNIWLQRIEFELNLERSRGLSGKPLTVGELLLQIPRDNYIDMCKLIKDLAGINAELLEALKYARRFVRDADTDFIDATIAKATGGNS